MSSEESVRACVVLPAAGQGTRMQIKTPKQFCHLLNRPIISYTIEAFEAVSLVDHIVVVTSADQLEPLKAILTDFGHDTQRVHLTEGKETRHRSIFCGVKKVAEVCSGTPDVVIIHDGVRPFVPAYVTEQIASAARQHGASGAVRPLISTIVRPDTEGLLAESLDRSKYRNSEMPQGFRYQVIRSAYDQCSDYDLDYGTECLHLALKYCGIRARLIDGPDCLWKVTHARDLFMAERVLREKTCHLKVQGQSSPLQRQLCDHLQQEGVQISSSKDDCKDGDMNLVIFSKDDRSNSHSDVSWIIDIEKVHQNLVGENIKSGAMIIYLCEGHNKDAPLTLSEEKEYEVMIQRFSKESNRLYVYGVMLQSAESAAMERTCAILVSLIKDRNPVFSGQIFKV